MWAGRSEANMKDQILLKAVELLQEFDPDHKDHFYRRVFDVLSEAIPYKYAALFLYDDQHRQLRLSAHVGKAVDLVEFVGFEMGRGLSAWVAKERKPIILNQLHAFSRHRFDIRSFLSLPMISGSELIGVLNFGHLEENGFPEDAIPEGMAIASLLAGVLAKNRLILRLSQQNRGMEEMNRQLQQTQQQLMVSERQSAVSATIVSLNHEINNPLMIIEGVLGLLSSQIDDPAVRQRLSVISQQAERIAATLRKMRTLGDPITERYIDDDDTLMLSLDANTSGLAME
jgi:signal transduction histidine kinase